MRLCAEPDEAFFSSAVFEFGSDPVETPSDLPPIIGVFVAVESFEEEHPLISAEMNGFGGFLAWHEWALAVSLNGLYCSTRVRGINPAPLQSASNLPMKTVNIVSHSMENVEKVTMTYGLITAQEESGNQCHLYVGSDALNDAIVLYLTHCDRNVQERFMFALTDHIRQTETVAE